MKVILSRKGFDSESGRYPSPILPDGRMYSFPIPSSDDKIRYDRLSIEPNLTYDWLMKELIGKGCESKTCHLDPDIYKHIYPRKVGWKGAFGQIGTAQRHLENQGVGIGDLFLFFGTFRRTMKNGAYRYTAELDKHVIFGYLQVGEIVHDESGFPWLAEHPHVLDKDRVNDATNAIYIARNKLSWCDKPGFGAFRFNDSLVLTKPDQQNHKKSRWQLPHEFRNLNISYHTTNSWKEDYFQSVGRGQEFVIQEDRALTKWVQKLFRNSELMA